MGNSQEKQLKQMQQQFVPPTNLPATACWGSTTADSLKDNTGLYVIWDPAWGELTENALSNITTLGMTKVGAFLYEGEEGVRKFLLDAPAVKTRKFCKHFKYIGVLTTEIAKSVGAELLPGSKEASPLFTRMMENTFMGSCIKNSLKQVKQIK